MERITDYLVADHERLGALLAAAGRGSAFEPEPYAEFRAGLLRHIAIEEQILLPAARRARGGAPVERAARLRLEHAAIASLLVPEPNLALCVEVVTLLEPHDALEESPGGVYEECERLWTRAESSELGRAARARRPVRVAPHLDWPNLYRTARAALAAASRQRSETDPPRSHP
ncbi:MAG: hemerythrin domain-containing protein [Polyangiaceae bacterium]|nr:hemerythrin domain-containing protein [Polyangiaceae bacterium]